MVTRLDRLELVSCQMAFDCRYEPFELGADDQHDVMRPALDRKSGNKSKVRIKISQKGNPAYDILRTSIEKPELEQSQNPLSATEETRGVIHDVCELFPWS